jgi:hypothetical protein
MSVVAAYYIFVCTLFVVHGGMCESTYLPAPQTMYTQIYEGHLESKERFAINKYLLIIGKKKNMQVLSNTFTTSPHSHLGH